MPNNPKKTSAKAHVSLFNQDVVKFFENKSDIEVWNCFNKGDEMAFNYLYRTYVHDLYRFGSQYSRDHGLVKDSIQNLFFYLRKKRGSLSEVTNIKGYLFRSLQREVIKNIKINTSLEGFEENFMEAHFQIEVSPEVNFIKNESEDAKKKLLEIGLNQLTTKQRKAILLFYEEELSYKEIAKLMNFNEVKTARKLIYRALAKLKEIIKPTSH